MEKERALKNCWGKSRARHEETTESTKGHRWVKSKARHGETTERTLKDTAAGERVDQDTVCTTYMCRSINSEIHEIKESDTTMEWNNQEAPQPAQRLIYSMMIIIF